MPTAHGCEIERQARWAIGPVFRGSIMPREVNILSPAAAEVFRRKREARLGFALENLLDGSIENDTWNAADEQMRAVGGLLLTHEDDGPFLLRLNPSYTDFMIVGNLQSACVVDEGVFQRLMQYPGYGNIYEACLPFMVKLD
ncbi:hypothetical protein N7466_005995 [Penicillium verhagenii]|uniref:uncharacterized protein n=1 Tax=Penicillium verhagenii TaxID=1562060 RepID=UPI0025457FAE|nr:uncharacterized protein N7466_005995 [Penicillium verhagenii]KAJ5930502.1 hypothetical protein N7466_005995 [Penicillium verhagenii]